MTTRDAILFSLQRSGFIVGMLTNDLSRQELNHRPCPGANAAAWILGHLILYERSQLKLLGVAPENMPRLPVEDFEQRFGREADAPRAADYGEAELLPRLFKDHRDAVISAVQAADERELARPLPAPSRVASTVGEALLFAGIHATTHAGQISTIRRSLGRPPVV